MPGTDGITICKKIRETSNTPIIMVSAKNMKDDKLKGLNLGADDYLSKPFNPLEIVARVNAMLRRFYKLGSSDMSDSMTFTVGELRLDVEKARFSKKNEEILLTPTEFKIMTLLMKNPGRVFTQVQIYEHVNGEYYENDDNTLMVHMSKLRDKIEDDSKNPRYIKTVRGLGYKLDRGL